MSVLYGVDPFRELGPSSRSWTFVPDPSSHISILEQARIFRALGQARDEAFRGNPEFLKYMGALPIFKEYEAKALPGTNFSPNWPTTAEKASDATEQLFSTPLFAQEDVQQTIKILVEKCKSPRFYVAGAVPAEVQLALLAKFAPNLFCISMSETVASLSNQQLRYLSEAMCHAPIMIEIQLVFHKDAGVAWNEEGISALARLVENADSLDNLIIGNARIDDTGVTLISKAAGKNMSLSGLMLDNVGCTAAGAKALPWLFQKNKIQST
jgi:hypothetical protein